MPGQLSLGIRSSLPYSPEHFVLHAGVHELYDHAVRRLSEDRYGMLLFEGAERTGKTHLMLKLAAVLRARGKYPRIFSGADFEEWMRMLGGLRSIDPDELILVDNAEEYMGSLTPARSGLFVQTIELLRNCSVPIAFFGSCSFYNNKADDHVNSRLKEAMLYELSSPDEADLSPVVAAMAKQRGLNVGERRMAFVLKRVPRDLPAIEAFFDRLLTLVHELGRALDFETLEDALRLSAAKPSALALQ